jgi:hypothetical protein
MRAILIGQELIVTRKKSKRRRLKKRTIRRKIRKAMMINSKRKS